MCCCAGAAPWCPPALGWRLFEKGPTNAAKDLHPDRALSNQSRPQKIRPLVCRACAFAITSEDQACPIEGRTQHTFFNPAGLLFEIGCFARAPGCEVRGEPTSEFSWFPAYYWSYALCGQCGSHLGWHFSSAEGGGFFGLILNRLSLSPPWA